MNFKLINFFIPTHPYQIQIQVQSSISLFVVLPLGGRRNTSSERGYPKLRVEFHPVSFSAKWEMCNSLFEFLNRSLCEQFSSPCLAYRSASFELRIADNVVFGLKQIRAEGRSKAVPRLEQLLNFRNARSLREFSNTFEGEILEGRSRMSMG